MKILLDANTIVSAFGTQGMCSEVFAYCLSEHEIVINQFIIEEVAKSLEEDFRMPKKKVREHRQFLLSETKVVVPLKVSLNICRDPKDLKVLGTAWADKVDVIVTGDKHLLKLKEFKGVAILTVREFWEKRKRVEKITI